MTGPSVPFIRPMSLAELLDRAIGLYRRNFVKFIGIIAIPYIPLVVFSTAMSFLATSSLENQPADDPLAIFRSASYIASVLGSVLVIILQFFLVQGVATAALTRAVADSYTGKEIGILGAYGNLRGSWLRLILALMLMGLIILAAWLWLIIPCVGWFSGIGIVAFLMLAVLPLIAPVVVLEGRGIRASARRAWELARSRFWWMVGFAFVLVLFGQLVITGPTLLLSFILRMAVPVTPDSLVHPQLWMTIIQSLVSMVAGLLYLPLQLTAFTVVYFDLRTRFEGLDLVLQASGTPAAETDAISMAEIAPISHKPLVTGAEIGYFVLLSIGAAAVYFLIWVILFGMLFSLSAGL